MPIDDLTQLYNRKDLFTWLHQEIARSKRTHIPFSILMIDADHFKEVNDNFGHLRGDRVLSEIAQILKQNCREMDIPCRYGGDEFVLIMPETDHWAVEKAAQRHLNKLGSHVFPDVEGQPDLHITVSIGCATFTAGLSTPELVIESADQALYAAKQQGRNRVVKDIDITEQKIKAPSLNFKSFIDRVDEMETLKTKFNSTVESNGKFFVMSGAAGIGKTRLVQEFKKYSMLRGAVFLSARPFEYGVTPPYHIFFQTLKEYFRDLSMHQRSVLNMIPEVYRRELGKFMPELRIEVDIKKASETLSTEYKKLRIFDTIFSVLTVISRTSPLILFFDDIQWSRAVDLELLGYCVRNITNLPIFIGITFRLEEVGEQHPLNQFLRAMSREHRFEKIELKGFDYNYTKQMLNIILGFAISEQICKVIYQETDGNPFYIEEIVKSFVDNGTVYWDQTNWSFKDIKEITLPSSIGDLLRRRLEGIDAELKELLTQSSAIGNEFSLPLLKELTDKNEGHLLDLLDSGVKNLLIKEESNDRYSFTNILLQRTLYENISASRRRRLHLKIAHALEKLYAGRLNEIYENLARHYQIAEEWQRAFEYNFKAANKLKNRYANQEAITHYHACQDLIKNNNISQPEMEIEIYKNLGDIYYLTGNYDNAIDCFDSLLDKYDFSSKHRSDIMLELGKVYHRKADYDNALEIFNKAIELLDQEKHKVEIAKLNTAALSVLVRRGEYEKGKNLADSSLKIFTSVKSDIDIANIYNIIGTMYYDKGEWDKANDYYKKVLNYREKTEDQYTLALGLNNLGNVSHRKSDYDRAIDYHSRALEIRKKIGDRYGIAASFNNLAVVYDDLGNWKKCMDYHQKSLDISKSLNISRSIALSYSNLGYVLIKMEAFSVSLEYSLQALKVAVTIGDINLQSSIQNNLAYAYLKSGNIDETYKNLEKSAKNISKYGFKNLLTENQRIFGEYYLQLNKLDEAEKYADKALNVALNIDDKESEAEAYLLSGRVYLKQEKLNESIKEFENCIKLLTTINNDFIFARCYYFLGVALKIKGDLELASKNFVRAREIFSRLGSKSFLKLIAAEISKL
jgi:diguanylate cyclase (GGDEF)-like protein